MMYNINKGRKNKMCKWRKRKEEVYFKGQKKKKINRKISPLNIEEREKEMEENKKNK